MPYCPTCGATVAEGSAVCGNCGMRADVRRTQGPPQVAAPPGIWYQNYYRIRKKVLAIANQYWIEDAHGSQLGYSRQKIIRIKENIRVFADDSMKSEIFRIQQEQVVDMWGTFAVLDSATNACLGKLRRQAMSSGFYVDEYLILDPYGQMVGRVAERGKRGLARKFLPGGALVPEQLVVEFYGQPVAEIKQQFKIIGDIWEVDCSRLPRQFDRRILLSAMLLMGMIERDRK